MADHPQTQDLEDLQPIVVRGGRRLVENGYITCSFLTAATFGMQAAVFLEYLMQWGAGRQWVNRTETEITADTTLSRSQQINARRVLRDAEVLDEDRRGLPASLHFRVSWGGVLVAMEHTPDREHPVRRHELDRRNDLTSSQNTANLIAESSGLLIGVNQREVSTGSITADPLPPNEDGGGVVALLERLTTPLPSQRHHIEEPSTEKQLAAPMSPNDWPLIERLIHADKQPAPPPNGDDTGRPADPLQAMHYETLIGRDIWRSIVADMKACNVELGAEWLRATLAFMPNQLTQATLLETFERVHRIATEAKTRDDASPPGYRMRNWRQWMRSRLQETAKEVLSGD